MLKGLTLAVLLCAFATPALAQKQPRTIDATSNANWTHVATGLILPPAIGDLTRGKLIDLTDDELDVSVRFERADGSLLATVYIYRPGVESIPLWFDRAQVAIEARSDFMLASGSRRSPLAFTPPKSTTASAMRIAYDLPDSGNVKSAAVALVPLADWIIKIRLSSNVLAADTLDERLTSFMEGMLWPQLEKASPEAVPILPCGTSLKFKRAKIVRQDGADTLLGALAALTALPSDEDQQKTSKPYCRELEHGLDWGVYRHNDEKDGYIIAFSDSGRAMRVSPAINLSGGPTRYSTNFLDLDRVSQYPPFNRLPQPEQVIASLDTVRPLSSTTRGGETVTLSSDTFK